MKAEIIGRGLGGRRFRGGWMARCPAHDDRKPSLSIREGDHGKVLVCCHAGCEQVGPEPGTHAWLHAECWPPWHQARRADAIAALRAMGIQA